MSDFEHGSMDITEHRRTWEGFVTFTKYSIISLVVLLVLMALFLV